MDKIYNDMEFINLVKDILSNDEFLKLKEIIHHDSNRYEHCVRVAYETFKVSKKLNFNVEEVTRAALLHDFFHNINVGSGFLKRAYVMIQHPKYALKNAKKYYELTPLQEDIILSHMFPVGLRLPRHIESVIVDILDDKVAIAEEKNSKVTYLKNAVSFMLILFICTLYKII